MDIALFLVALAVGVLVVTSLAERLDVSPPLVLIAVGVAVSYAPGMPEVRLEPDVVLLGLLPPLLYSTAISSSLVDFKNNRRSILLLSVGLVAFTTVGVAVLVYFLVDEIPWWAAFAIGAVVAPPDAVAATAIGRRIGLPRRIVTILEGESLLNDATALVALRTATGAVGVGVAYGEVGLDFVLAAGGGVLVGLVVFSGVAWIRKHISDPVLDTAISLVVPFAAYLVAEELHGSGVIAVVVAGLLLGHNAPVLMTAQSRIAERMNYRTIAYVLENAVFLLIGLQASWLFRDVGRSELAPGKIVALCGLTLLAVIVLRMVWVFGSRFALVRPGPERQTNKPPPWSYTLLLSWAGMRGVVTLAAAFVIPETAPYREILLLVAFTVVAGTLFIQGLTLPLLARWLKVPAPDPMDDALARATLLQQASKAGFEKLREKKGEDGYDDPHGVVALIKQRIEQRNFAAWERLGTTVDQQTPSELYADIRGAMIGAEREKVLKIRSKGMVDAEVVADVLALLDVEESMIDRAEDERRSIRDNMTVRSIAGFECDELLQTPTVVTSDVGVCEACLRDDTSWVALRQCLTCGNVACCDSSSGRHAEAHFHETQHPVMQSAEPDEEWRWCYVHHLTG